MLPASMPAVFLRKNSKKRWHRGALEFFTTAGPGVNEAISNGLLDFAFQGDLPSLVGKAGGLDTRLILAGSRNGTFYIGATPSFGIQLVADLKGRKMGLFKGTAVQLAAQRVLAGNGLTESDLRIYNMDSAAGNSAIASGDIDALFGGSNLFNLRDQGLLRLIYDGRIDDNRYGYESGVLVLGAFAKKYPEIAYRVVKIFVQARNGARWRKIAILSTSCGQSPAHRLLISEKTLRGLISRKYFHRCWTTSLSANTRSLPKARSKTA